MHPSKRAERAAIAQSRLVTTVTALAKRFGLAVEAEAVAAAHHRDVQLDHLFKSEALADLLDALERATKPKGKPKGKDDEDTESDESDDAAGDSGEKTG